MQHNLCSLSGRLINVDILWHQDQIQENMVQSSEITDQINRKQFRLADIYHQKAAILDQRFNRVVGNLVNLLNEELTKIDS